MVTERLYHNDSFLLTFSARLVDFAAWQGRPSVILERTAFYPESGGQMADRGTLGGRVVVDVQVDDADVVHHVLGEAPPSEWIAKSTEIEGKIEKSRRRDHMALHTGQHMLSRALADEADAPTVSSRLGETGCTIDVDAERLDENRVARAEDLVNAVIDDDVRVRAFFPTDAELAALPLRRRPKVTENVRVVCVGDFDVTPCGGTHCATSAQVGFVHVTGLERYKGKMRVHFTAGPRGRRATLQEADALRALGRSMSCDPLDVVKGIGKLQSELQAAQNGAGAIRGALADALADVWLARAQQIPFVVGRARDGGAPLLRAIATRITSADKLAVLTADAEDGLALLVARPAASAVDCGALVKRIAAITGGRGGGRKEHAEGKLPADAPLESALEPLMNELFPAPVSVGS